MSFSKKIIVIASVGALVAYSLYNHYTNNPTPTGKRVAVLLPAVHPSMNAIEQGFSTTLKTGLPTCTITVFNANGDKVLMKGQVEKITSDTFDLIFTVGTTASQMTKTALVKKQSSTPLIFAAISDPAKRGVIDPSTPQEAVTGVIESYDYADQVDLLLTTKPETKHVTIVYDPASNPALEEVASVLKKELEKKNINVQEVSIFALKDLQQKVPAFLPQTDVVLTLTDHTVCSGMDSLIKLCARNGVTLFTSELDSNDKGAALSYGVQEADYGKEAAKQALTILKENMPAHSIPVTSLKDFYLLVNTDTAAQQGLMVDESIFQNPRIKAHTKKEACQ